MKSQNAFIGVVVVALLLTATNVISGPMTLLAVVAGLAAAAVILLPAAASLRAAQTRGASSQTLLDNAGTMRVELAVGILAGLLLGQLWTPLGYLTVLPLLFVALRPVVKSAR